MADYVMPRIQFRKDAEGNFVPLNPRSIYDSLSDTYLLFLYGAPEPSISLDVTDSLYALLDPETEDLIGIQIEAFAEAYIPQHPWLQPHAQTSENSSRSEAGHERNEHRDLAIYLVGALMTEGSLATA